MAEGTRLKELHEAQKRLDQIIQTETLKREATEMKLQDQISNVTSEVKKQLGELTGRFDHFSTTLASLQLQLQTFDRGKSSGEGSILGDPSHGWNNDGTPKTLSYTKNKNHTEGTGMNIISPLPKLDFPRFDGTHPRAWMLKCQGYFKLIPNIPDDQKVTLASMHFEGRAAQWFQNLSPTQTEITWKQFMEVVFARFEELKETKIIYEFNKLKHIGPYSEYVDRFEELRACMSMLNRGGYSEEYYIASFISGLSEELQAFILMFEPTTLAQTIELGRKQLHTLEALTKKLKPSIKLHSVSQKNYKKWEFDGNGHGKGQSSFTKKPFKLLTSAEMAARRDKGLCYNCDELYKPGHRCIERVVNMIMTEGEEAACFQSIIEAQDEEISQQVQMEEIQMSINVITGEGGLTTMRLYGEVDNKKLHILIDSGSTLNFIKEETTRSLGYKI